MDNASKALMIAGEMLIALLVIGLIASAISNFGGFSANMTKKMDKNKQEEFNNNFFAFQGRIDITADEIAGIVNFCKHNNDSSELFLKNDDYLNNKQSPDFVEATVEGVPNFFNVRSDTIFNSNIRTFLKEHNGDFYSCDALITGVNVERDKNDNSKILSRTIFRTFQNNNNVVLNTENNGRKGYVKSIEFFRTKSTFIDTYSGEEYLTIKNRNDFVIN